MQVQIVTGLLDLMLINTESFNDSELDFHVTLNVANCSHLVNF